MNKGANFFGNDAEYPPRLVGYTTSNASAINVPKDTQYGDFLFYFAGTRNGTITPPSSFIRLFNEDAVTSEMNLVYYKEVGENEPSSYTFTLSAGQVSAIMVTWRPSIIKRMGIQAARWYTGSENAPQLYGYKNGIYVAVAFDALSGTHVSSFTGLTTIASLPNANTNVCVSYRELTEDGLYGSYPASPTGASNDGYAGLTFS